jgi:uncharacterized integral membrane protein
VYYSLKTSSMLLLLLVFLLQSQNVALLSQNFFHVTASTCLSVTKSKCGTTPSKLLPCYCFYLSFCYKVKMWHYSLKTSSMLLLLLVFLLQSQNVALLPQNFFHVTASTCLSVTKSKCGTTPSKLLPCYCFYLSFCYKVKMWHYSLKTSSMLLLLLVFLLQSQNVALLPQNSFHDNASTFTRRS